MKRARFPPRFLERTLIYYPMIRRFVPTFRSPLQPFAEELLRLRACGRTVDELRTWVHQKTGWRPCARAIYRTLAGKGMKRK